MATYLQNARFAAQLTYNSATGTSAFLPFSAVLTQNPAIIIFDNQSSVPVTISDDGTTAGKTFSAGEALVLDLRANGPQAKELTWRLSTQFYASSTAGAGNFYISIVYAS